MSIGEGYEPLVPAYGHMMRLTGEQYSISVRDALGEHIEVPTDLEPDEEARLYSSIGASQVGTSPYGVEQYLNAALDIADQVLDSRTKYSSLCAAEAVTPACIDEFIRDIGERLWRRPLTDDEVARYASVAEAGGTLPEDLDVGLRYALAGLLQSPHFLYLVHVGEPVEGATYRQLTAHELASRLSYALTDGPPDGPLRAAADDGSLLHGGTLEAEIERLLQAPRARRKIVSFFAETYGVDRLKANSKDATLFPVWEAGLMDLLLEEFARVVTDNVFEADTDYRRLYNGRQSFLNAALAEFYGVPAVAEDFSRVPLAPNRAGLLTSGAVMAATSHVDVSSPTVRGIFVMERLLCQHVPAPPANVNDVLVQDRDASLTVREQLELHRSDPTCAGCHALFDPIGVTFENFDAIGAYREVDNGHPVDASAEWNGRQVEGARELADILVESELIDRCLAQHLFSFVTGHSISEGEEGQIELLGDYLDDNDHRLSRLIVAALTSPGFRLLRKE